MHVCRKTHDVEARQQYILAKESQNKGPSNLHQAQQQPAAMLPRMQQMAVPQMLLMAPPSTHGVNHMQQHPQTQAIVIVPAYNGRQQQVLMLPAAPLAPPMVAMQVQPDGSLHPVGAGGAQGRLTNSTTALPAPPPPPPPPPPPRGPPVHQAIERQVSEDPAKQQLW